MSFFIDVTEVMGLGATTGVQRVVREVTRRSMIQGCAEPHDIVPVVAVGGRLHRLNAAGLHILEPAGSSVRANNAAQTQGPFGQSLARAKSWLRRRAFGIFGMAERLRFERRMLRLIERFADPVPVLPAVGDTLVLIDTFWNGSTVLTAARRARSEGARIVLVIYDLLPIRQPHQVHAQLAHVFPTLMRSALAMADGVLTISQTVTTDVRDYLGHALPEDRIRHFYLGQDFAVLTREQPSPDRLPPAFADAGEHRYLMIGTLEPRRGHAYALDAFERLWAAGGEQRLMLIGKVGWQMDFFLARCQCHPRLGTHLFLIHDAPDDLLADAVKASDAVILTSYFEGFGLPLVEALLMKKPVIASDIPIFREIAGDTPLFFRVGDDSALADAVTLFERDSLPWRTRASAFHWLDWNASATMFFDEMARLALGKREI